jgi:DNA-binding ferritin-like protein
LELEKKEEIIARLREQLKASDDAHETATADIVDKYEAQIKALEAEKTKVSETYGHFYQPYCVFQII